MIVLASFLCFVVVDGTIFSMGRFLDELEKHFNASKSSTAWVASIMSGWYLLVGETDVQLFALYYLYILKYN